MNCLKICYIYKLYSEMLRKFYTYNFNRFGIVLVEYATILSYVTIYHEINILYIYFLFYQSSAKITKIFFEVSSRTIIILHNNQIKLASLKENIWYHLRKKKKKKKIIRSLEKIRSESERRLWSMDIRL